MMPVPSACVPFVEYVLRAIDHPPHMFVSKLAACCAVLFLTRSDPKLLRSLCYRWATRFLMDRAKLISIIRCRAESSGLGIGSSQSQLDCREQPGPCSLDADREGQVAVSSNEASGQDQGLVSEYIGVSGDSCPSINVCNTDKVVDYFLRIMNSLAHVYFSWNWDSASYIVKMNKEYETALREIFFPICISTEAEDGVDDEEQSPYLLPLHINKLRSDAEASLKASLSMPHGLWDSKEGDMPQKPEEPCPPGLQGSSRDAPTTCTASGVVANLGGDMNSEKVSSRAATIQANDDDWTKSNQTHAPHMLLEGDEKQEKGSSTEKFSPGDLSQPEQSKVQIKCVLTFLTLSNFEKRLRSNKKGLVILFYAKHSTRSNEALEILAKIARQRTVDPLPSISVVYSVAEPELASLFDVRWFPTIVYVPQNTFDLNDIPKNFNNAQEGGVSSRGQEETIETHACNSSSDIIAGRAQEFAGPSRHNESQNILLNGEKFPQVKHTVQEQVPYRQTIKDADLVTKSKTNKSLSNIAARLLEPPIAHIPITPLAMQLIVESPTKVLYGLDTPNGCFPFLQPPNCSKDDIASHRRTSGLFLDVLDLIDNSKTGRLAISAIVEMHVKYPMDGVMSLSELSKWISSKGKYEPQISRVNSFAAEVITLREDQKFKESQEFHSGLVMLRQMQRKSRNSVQGYSENTAAAQVGSVKTVPSQDALSDAEESLQFIFFGGGMAAGKSTIAMALAQTSWWANHKRDIVLINVDDFKTYNPNETFPTSEEHARSTRNAEKAMVEALNQGRNIVYDSTMMWAPFVLQVVSMIRHAHTTLYEQGSGFLGEDKPEVYFIPSQERATPLPKPYVIHFMGITVEPHVAVPRGLLRKFENGRGVPIQVQLNSFKLFSKNFVDYTEVMDVSTLYNNNVIVDLNKEELPPILAQRSESTNGELRVYDEVAYQTFQRQQYINIQARNIMEIYLNDDTIEML